MIIDDAVIDASLLAEDKFLKGECTLDDALSKCMAIGAPIPTMLRRAYDQAIREYYTNVQVKDLAELITTPWTTKQKRDANQIKRQITRTLLVEGYARRGLNLNNPKDATCEKKGGTLNAFIQVGNDLKLSAHTIYRDYNFELKRTKNQVEARKVENVTDKGMFDPSF
jgi:hypothetical protein